LNFLQEISQNQAIIAALISWFSAQLFKVILTFFKTKNIDFGRFIGSGGMPSAHSAFTVSLAVSIGKLYSYNSPTFALACAFALVVMYDAAGVRRAVGSQASIINNLIEDYSKHREIKQEKLMELVGHTPFEVLVGALLGIIIANLYIG
jgi:uncharacterized protein